MKTEDIPLNIKSIFVKKGINYTPRDIALMRLLCTQIIQYILTKEETKWTQKRGKPNYTKKEG